MADFKEIWVSVYLTMRRPISDAGPEVSVEVRTGFPLSQVGPRMKAFSQAVLRLQEAVGDG